ncbi:MAG: hypothetical protein CR972_03375 [Candidatus Moraniibacteriota bacterium]|nr:MAG: hypothetical protein CR972_03375 [Candidatus Moranbacteria bacterium]
MIGIFFNEQIIFIAITSFLLFMPGWLFLLAFFHRKQFAPLEKFVLAVPMSFVITTLAIIITNACGFALTQTTLISVLGVVLALLCFGIFRKKKELKHNTNQIFTFTKKQAILITILIVFTIVIKGTFLINAIFPTATDLGHHMFWVEKITKEQSLPEYKKTEILVKNDEIFLSKPKPIADFIVGEHVIFATIKTFTGQTTVSIFPSLILFIINIFTVLMIFILTRQLTSTYTHGDIVSIFSLLFTGPLWAISGAGAKFVSGGVIGNIIGNLLIPTIIYFLYRAFCEKKPTLLIPAIITATALAYTHHLSTFIFGYIFIFSIITFIIFQRKGLRGYKNIFLLIKNYYIIPLLIIVIASLFFLHPPSYLNGETVSSSVGAPSKSTRTGIHFNQMMYMLGETRFILGLIGFFAVTGFMSLWRYGKLDHIDKKHYPVNIYAGSLILGWCGALLGMSMFPHILQVNIISSRIATYSAFPLAILSAFSLVWLGTTLLRNKDKRFFIPQGIILTFFFITLTYAFATGMRDNSTSMNDMPKTNSALQTFHAGHYANKAFGKNAENNDYWMIKDHNYITADTWLKVFFAHDYSYPLSRSYFKRYETNPNRERCTLHMISSPESPEAQSCFTNLSTKIILVNTEQDASQFLHSENFYRIYQNNELSLFVRK